MFNLKEKYLIFFLIFALIDVNAQSLLELYKIIPEEYLIAKHKYVGQMLVNYRNGDRTLSKIWYRFDLIDEKNGYLKTSGISAGTLEIKSWNLNGYKLIAIYRQTCDPICGMDFSFFRYKNGLVTKADIDSVIPG